MLNIPLCVIIVKFVSQENDKYYPQVHLHECFYGYEHNRSEESKCITYLDANNLYGWAMSQYSTH